MSPEQKAEDQNVEIVDDDDDFDAADEALETIYELLDNDEFEKIRRFFLSYNITDQADILEKCDPDHRIALVILCKDSLDPELYSEIDSNVRKSILESFDAREVAHIVSELESDDALDLISKLDPDFRQEIIEKLSTATRAHLEEGLTFSEKSAGRLMQRHVVAIPQFWTVGKTIDYLRAAGEHLPEDFYSIYVVDTHYHVMGEVSTSRILSAQRSIKIEDLSNPNMFVITADEHQEDVAYLFRKEHLVSAPVTDSNNRLIGMITADDIMDVIQEEASEDILKLGGVTSSSDIYNDVLQTTKSRFSWLALNLLTAIAASLVIGLFEGTLEQIVALAVLMPIVASMGGNAGTQTLTVAVRALATKELSQSNILRFVVKETATGLINGVLFAVIVALITILWFHSIALGVVIGLAMVINLIVAGVFGIIIPIVLDKMDIDPALASAVFLTTVTDVVGFFAFLGLAAVILL